MGLHSLQDKVCVQCYMKRSNQKPGSQGCSWWVLGNGSCWRGEGIVSKDLSSNMASDSLYIRPFSNAYYPGRTCGRLGTCRKKKNRIVPVKENFTLCIFIFHALHRRLKKSALLVQMSYNRKHEFYFVYCFPVPDWVPKAIFWGIIAFFCCNESPLHGSFHNSRTGHVLGKIRALSFFVFFFLNLVHRVFNVFSYPSCDWKSRTFKSIAPNFQRMETPTNTLSDYLCRTSELMNLLLFVDNCIFSLCGPEAFGLET